MNLSKFEDKLPIIKNLKPKEKLDGVPYYKIRMQQFKQKLHRDLPETTVWGFEGKYPGPIIEVRRNEWIKVKWINDLPEKHLLPVDTTIHGAEPNKPRVRTVIHLHGGVVRPESDGYPDAWFTKGYKIVGPYFTRKIYDYPNRQRGTTLWYHAHAIGITRLNVYAGLAGPYIIRDPLEKYLNLPEGQYEMPLLIQDRSFNDDGSLYYPTGPQPPVPNVCPSIVPDFFGDTILVNGKVWPYLEVEPRKYRFRIINGSNSRFYRIRLSSGQPFYQIGNDGGLLETPIIAKQILLAPAERADVIIDFSNFRGHNIIITNDAPSPYPRGNPVDSTNEGQIMQFRVSLLLSQYDFSTIPYRLSSIMPLFEKDARLTRNLTLVRETDKYGRAFLLLDGKRWDDPITIKPLLGSIEVWSLINLANSTHPIHIHLVNFQILDRQPFDVEHYKKTKKILTTGTAVLPELNERGWKDTVRANPGEITRIIMKFTPYVGLYPWHCHILEHEDHEMMRPFEIVNQTFDYFQRIN
ncbi:multicopper oxidase domain-containing protein [Alkaliphilus pronyensis]|uniref:Multicopper oxidase domain-containing protein n=1 Tax=Alkaliphilus pronyensis TaxID=1482732 RepID=A0A6I0FGR9_9FIRM|nr:multicopper oxidase [Alkaliphilus pronyensis]KAB3535371.1 multicopper oxidase domain-containing protein [Alkaliphilus pronyensis]